MACAKKKYARAVTSSCRELRTATSRRDGPIRRTRRSSITFTSPARAFTRIVTEDGDAEVYGVGKTCLMFTQASGHQVWPVMYEIARVGNWVIIPVGCPTCAPTPSMIPHLPDELRADAVVASSGGDILAAVRNASEIRPVAVRRGPAWPRPRPFEDTTPEPHRLPDTCIRTRSGTLRKQRDKAAGTGITFRSISDSSQFRETANNAAHSSARHPSTRRPEIAR